MILPIILLPCLVGVLAATRPALSGVPVLPILLVLIPIAMLIMIRVSATVYIMLLISPFLWSHLRWYLEYTVVFSGIIIACALIWFLHTRGKREFGGGDHSSLKDSKILLFGLLFFGGFIASFLWGQLQHIAGGMELYGAGRVRDILIMTDSVIICFVVYDYLVRTRNIKPILLTVLVAFLLLTSIGFLQIIKFPGIGIIQPYEVQLGNYLWDSNEYANYLLSTLAILGIAFLAFCKGFATRALFIAAMLLGLVNFYFTYSFTQYLAFLVVLVIACLFFLRYAAPFVSFVAGLTIYWLPASLREKVFVPQDPGVYSKFDRLLSFVTGQGALEQLLPGRYPSYEFAVQQFVEKPFFGQTLGQGRGLILEHGHHVDYFVHNSYLIILSELGLIGMALLALFLFFIFKTSLKNIGETKGRDLYYLQVGAFLAIIACLIYGLSYFSMWYNINLWIAVAITAAIHKILRAERGSRPQTVEPGT